QVDHFLCIVLFVRQVTDRDIGALARVSDRDGAADAGIATGDERLAAGQPAAALVAGLAMVRSWIHLAGQSRPWLVLRGEGWVRVALRLARIDQIGRAHVCTPVTQ